MSIEKIKNHSRNIRRLILKILYLAQSGHSAGSLDLADIYATLFSKYLKYDKNNPKWEKRDYLILSNGHTCPVFYSSLVEFGCISYEEVKTLRKMGSIFQGHPHNLSNSYIENSSGPLGQGLSFAVGLCAQLKRDKKQNRVFCFVGDGELEEGQIWEALMFANKEKLNNLIIIVDRNNIQIDGNTKNVMPLEPLHKKISSFGALTIDIDGNNINQIDKTFEHVLNLKQNKKPICIIAKTIPGHPISFMNNFKWHGKAPNKEEYEKALEEIEKY